MPTRASAPLFRQSLEPLEEIPGFLVDPVGLGAGIAVGVGVAADEGAEDDGVVFPGALELGGDVGRAGGDGDFGQCGDAVVGEVLQDAVFATLFAVVGVDPLAGGVVGAGGLEIG